MKILEFDTEAEAQAALDVVNAIGIAWKAQQGVTIVDEPISPTGKRALTKRKGEDAPDKCGTLTWDEVRESPDGTFYFSSPINKTSYANWRDHLPEGVVMPGDKDMPEAWKVEDDA